MTGIPSACGFVSSRARNPHAPARHPLARIPPKVAGIRFIAQLPDSSEDETAFHHAQALLARLDAHLGASAFDDVYASSENNETQCREAFRTIFEARGQIQHFEMMTAQGDPT